MQIMPGTWTGLTKKYGKTDYNINNPDHNKEIGTLYLNELLNKYGNETHALMAYNWGPGNVDAYLKTGKGIKGQPIPKETIDYVKKINGTEIKNVSEDNKQTKNDNLLDNLENYMPRKFISDFLLDINKKYKVNINPGLFGFNDLKTALNTDKSTFTSNNGAVNLEKEIQMWKNKHGLR